MPARSRSLVLTLLCAAAVHSFVPSHSRASQLASFSSLRSSYLDNLDDASSSSAQPSSTPSSSSSSASLSYRLTLLELSVETLRGTQPNTKATEKYGALITELEALEQTSSSTTPGTYNLIYSTSPEGLFRSSPFFLTARAVCKTEDDAAKFSWFCQMHRKALAISRIATVLQVSSPGEERCGVCMVLTLYCARSHFARRRSSSRMEMW